MLRLSANWAMSFLLTSAMIPRPNCATLPVTRRSVSTTHFVWSASTAWSCAVIIASALPLPVVSRPSPWSTALWFASSRSTKTASPLNAVAIAPSFTFTTPR
ncbi:unannotated protein [freshwater metagenome]|uniref:Unannotated protein n=1 Tax=freshwater metagenome TaxID=449393 RepID=A0A6J6GC09_9ZZZZ